MSDQLDLSGGKKRKRGERVFKFRVFGERGYPAEFGGGSFHENVRELLEFGRLESGSGGGGTSWSFRLEVRRHPSLHLFLFVVEEPIEVSIEPSCKHCHYIGWGKHMICNNKKYHFVMPYAPNDAGSSRSDEYCKSNVIELMQLQGDDNHTLHGVFHSNGFGHLLGINGFQTGSDLPGYQIMDFWDRLCTGLGARKVSLKDVSKKKGMDLRLLHTLAYGKPWFGRWDYTFGRGTYGVNQETYQTALKAIQTIPLSLIAQQIGFLTTNYNQNHDIQTILPKYQMLSGHSLVTLGDLFHFMLELKFQIPKESSNNNVVDSSHYPGIMSDASCRWSPKRVEMAIHVVVEALKRAEARWVSRQHVRDAARAYIGDTGLLDFVLKSLGNHMVGKYFVRRCLNPVTKVLEYCLEDVSRAFIPNQEANSLKPINPKMINWGQLMRDILCMYNGVLATIPMASRIILDSKYFVKEFGGISLHNEPNRRTIYCTVVSEAEPTEESAVVPYHSFELRSSAVFDDLRCEVEKTFREIYFGLRKFEVTSIRNINPKGSDLVFKIVKPDSKITFEGKHQGGLLSGAIGYHGCPILVDCVCGVKDDDGERMVSCDICQVWQHTRCVQIPDSDEVPNIFLCRACEQDILLLPSLP